MTALLLLLLVVFLTILWKQNNKLQRALRRRRGTIEKLRAARRAVQEANAVKTAFLSNISHEIRNPVGVMLGFADLLADPTCLAQLRPYYASVLQKNGRALLKVLNDILDLSKLESNRLRVEESSVDLTLFIRSFMLDHRIEALAKGIDFKITWHDPVPRGVVTDSPRLRQILDTVVGNAIKFTERGYVHLEISSTSEEEGTALLNFELTDTGPGIPTSLVDRLFRPFEQADSSFTRQYGGTGVGLALAKKLAQAISGDLILKASSPGKGSSFLLAVHMNVVWPSEQQQTGQRKEQDMLERRLEGQTILVAEDSPDNRFLLARLLRLEGANVTLAENGLQAFEKASKQSFDVILMDIQMPQMDGLEAARRLRAGGYLKPIVALTAHAMKEDKIKSLAAGLNDHVTKPIHREELVRAVQRWAWSGRASAV